jgi:hypothetical protein
MSELPEKKGSTLEILIKNSIDYISKTVSFIFFIFCMETLVYKGFLQKKFPRCIIVKDGGRHTKWPHENRTTFGFFDKSVSNRPLTESWHREKL